MMKIRTAEQLQEVLDADFSWRLKEIADIRSAAESARLGSQKTLIRAGVALLYAHWEGFVKQSTTTYIRYVSCQRLRHSELRSCFVALSLKARLHQIGESNKANVNVQALEAILDGQRQRASFAWRDPITKTANMKSTVFVEIACWVGLNVTRYEPKWRFIDDRLVKRRNAIAHGGGGDLELDETGFKELAGGVIELLRWFKTDIENAVSNRAFLRAG